jgi:hypothetical protein
MKHRIARAGRVPAPEMTAMIAAAIIAVAFLAD